MSARCMCTGADKICKVMSAFSIQDYRLGCHVLGSFEYERYSVDPRTRSEELACFLVHTTSFVILRVNADYLY